MSDCRLGSSPKLSDQPASPNISGDDTGLIEQRAEEEALYDDFPFLVVDLDLRLYS